MRLHAKGDRVVQPQYGVGTVTDFNAHHTVIDFDEHGVRRFITNLVTLEPSSEPAPPRARGKGRAKVAKAKAASRP